MLLAIGQTDGVVGNLLYRFYCAVPFDNVRIYEVAVSATIDEYIDNSATERTLDDDQLI